MDRGPTRGYPAKDGTPFCAAPFRASMALTEFASPFSKTPLPMVLSTKPSIRPFKFLPSRMTIASMSVVPSGFRLKL